MGSLCKPKENQIFRMNCLQTKGKPPLSKENLETKGQPKLSNQSNGRLFLLEQILLPKLNRNYTETKGNSTSSHEKHGKPQETPLKAFRNQLFLMESLYTTNFKRKPMISNGIPLQTKGNPKISNELHANQRKTTPF